MVRRRVTYLAMLVFFIAMWVIGEGSRKGSDDRAQEVITEGNSGYHRWVSSLWTPGQDAEKGLFALQGIVGCVLGGYCLHQLRRPRKGGKP